MYFFSKEKSINMKKQKLNYYPMKMQPVYKNYIWGGTRLLEHFNKDKDSEFSTIAESWEVSCNLAGLTTISDGIFRGKTLQEIVNLSKSDFLGKNNLVFPIIVKLIDAQKDLSIQVHPSEGNANTDMGESAKSEFWYIVDCDKDSYIYYGFKEDISKKEFINSIKTKTICGLLNKINIKKGEAYYIPAGTIHALGKGALVAEIQQNSNTTFRIYDYDRVDCNGKLRELHIDRAVEVLNFKRTDVNLQLKENFSNFECEYFKVRKITISKDMVFNKSRDNFDIIQFISGKGIIVYNNTYYNANLGDTFFIPAKIKNYYIKGQCDLLITQA